MADRPIKIGLNTPQQRGSYRDLRETWKRAEALGVDSLWVWDHFFPLSGDPGDAHFEGMSLLAAMAEVTETPLIGALVSCNSYRNPNLLADMHRTIDHISGGRVVLEIGSGWFERDYDEYGYPFKTAPDRLRDLAAALPVIRERFKGLNPGPVNGEIPILIGGSGEKVTLRLVAEYAAMWNAGGDPTSYGHSKQILDDWCARLGRDPESIERTAVVYGTGDISETLFDRFVDNGATHLIVVSSGPDWDLANLERLAAWRERRTG